MILPLTTLHWFLKFSRPLSSSLLLNICSNSASVYLSKWPFFGLEGPTSEIPLWDITKFIKTANTRRPGALLRLKYSYSSTCQHLSPQLQSTLQCTKPGLTVTLFANTRWFVSTTLMNILSRVLMLCRESCRKTGWIK